MLSSNKLFATVILTLSFTVVSLADTARSNALVSEAWKAWGENNQHQVEEKFAAALREDPSNLRARIGLYLLYQMQGKERQAWESLKAILQSKENLYPHAFALGYSPVFNYYLNASDPAALAFLNQLSVKADPEGVLKAMASEDLGEYYRSRGDLAKSDQHYKNMSAIRDWLLIGPFENVSASGFDKVFPPETEFAADKTYEAKRGIPARWYRPAAYQPNYWLDFRQHYVDGDAIYYANTFVFSPKKQKAQIRVGTSGSLKVFLNDEQLFEYFDENNNDLDTYVIETELQEGWNRLLIKVGQSELERCNFLARVTDAAGEPVSGLEFSSDAKNYARKPNAPARVIENFAEAFFKAAIKNAPDAFENYALLADVYLQNDKATEAELVLKDALKRLPNCALFYVRMLDAYMRGEKNDEYYTTREQIYSLDKNIPAIIDGKISDHLERGETDKAEELLKEYERLAPGSERLMEIRLALLIQKGDVARRNELVRAALLKYPTNWTFVESAAAQSIESTKRYTRAISLVEKYLTTNYDLNALDTLAEYYLSVPNERKWAETYNRIFTLEPVAPHYYSEAAKTYFEMKNYAAAEKMIRKAIELCAGASAYWTQLGEIQRSRNESQLAIQSYREALKFNPFDYDARRILRELEGKPLIFTLFDTPETRNDVKEIIAKAPDAKAYPEKGAVILLQDTKRVVYPEGASELMGEWLIKVFNKQGVDAFKEQMIGYNGYTQALSVEKAVVFKPNGTEIKADVVGGHAVFKTLEENDTIYIKWNVKNYNSGKLYRDFWDTQYFNSLYPSVLVRYSLLVPQGYKFKSNALNMPPEPSKRETEAGTIHQWEVRDEPAIEIESSMPGIADIGKVLYVSSINDWGALVDWYSDVAKAKTRSTYEIKEQVEKLFADKKDVSDEEKIERIYNFITENIRYSSVPFRQSGLIPQKARDVLVNKIGDCKDVSTLAISMLNEVGVKSYYTLLNTRDAGQNVNSVPAILFNHCIIGVETPGGIRYLDLTAQNHPVNTLPILDTEAFSLLIKPGVSSAGPLATNASPFGQTSHRSVLTVKDDMSVEVEHQTEWRGMTSAFPRGFFRFKSGTEREKLLSGSLAQVFPGLKMKKQEFEGLDQPGLSAKSTYYFDAPNYVTEAGQFKILKLPWYDRLSVFPPPSEEKRKYPYMFFLYADRLSHRIEIKLPSGYEPVDLGKETKLSSAVADYHLSFSYADGVITAKREVIRKKLSVSPEEYAEFKQFFNRVIKEDDRSILLKAKN